MNRLAIICVVLMMAACAVRPQVCVKAPEHMTPAEAYEIVVAAPRLEGRYVGFIDAPSCYFAAYQVLRAQPDAARQLERVYRHGTPAAKLYAYHGLLHVDAAVAREIRKEPFFESDEYVSVRFGDLQSDGPVRDVIAALETSDFLGN